MLAWLPLISFFLCGPRFLSARRKIVLLDSIFYFNYRPVSIVITTSFYVFFFSFYRSFYTGLQKLQPRSCIVLIQFRLKYLLTDFYLFILFFFSGQESIAPSIASAFTEGGPEQTRTRKHLPVIRCP